METIEETTTKTSGFVNHVFNFDAETKGDLMNLIQYSVLAIFPIVFLNKLIQHYVPEADEEKGSPEIILEILLQLSLLLTGMFFINRLVTYLPMYSGKDLGNVNLIHVLLAFLIIILSLQTKLGEKVEIISNRILGLWFEPTEETTEQPKNIIKVRQPITRQMPSHQPSQADNLARNMDMPPSTQIPMTQPTQQVQEQSQPQLQQHIQQQKGGVFPIIKDKVDNNELGAKTGKGLYDYYGKSEKEILRKRDRLYLRQLEFLENTTSFKRI